MDADGMIARFCVPGPPVAKGRPRIAMRGRHPVAYTPERTVRYESTVALIASESMRGRPPETGPVELWIAAEFPIPASWPKNRRHEAAEGRLAHGHRPDADNVAKAVLDGLSGIVVADDSQVAVLYCSKTYSDTPRVRVLVRQWNPSPVWPSLWP